MEMDKSVMSSMKNYGKGYAPKGIPGLNLGKKDGSETSPNKRGGSQGIRKTQEIHNPTIKPRLAKKSDDKSSGQSNPINRGDDNKKRYTPTKQPVQNSNNGTPKPTRFIC